MVKTIGVYIQRETWYTKYRLYLFYSTFSGGNEMKPKIAFICVHNSCRSQMAEALGKLFASGGFDSYSAGTETKDEINTDAVRTIKKLYGIDKLPRTLVTSVVS